MDVLQGVRDALVPEPLLHVYDVLGLVVQPRGVPVPEGVEPYLSQPVVLRPTRDCVPLFLVDPAYYGSPSGVTGTPEGGYSESSYFSL